MIVFIAAVMAGVQIPNFVDQYVKRVDAHYVEVKANFRKYQEAADEFHGGSIEALIDLYDSENNPSFPVGELTAIRTSRQRLQRFSHEQENLQAGFWYQLKFLILHGDRELIVDTQRNYSASLPLNVNAAICGIGSGIVAAMCYELLLFLLRLLFRRKYRRAAHC